MSTVMDNMAGAGRNVGTNTWLGLLILSLLIFGANTTYSISKAARLGGASTAASNLQVNSQRLVNQGRQAVGGDAKAFVAFKSTQRQIKEDIDSLNTRFGDTLGVAGPINTVTATSVTSMAPVTITASTIQATAIESTVRRASYSWVVIKIGSRISAGQGGK